MGDCKYCGGPAIGDSECPRCFAVVGDIDATPLLLLAHIIAETRPELVSLLQGSGPLPPYEGGE
jgi:hypothetical protein